MRNEPVFSFFGEPETRKSKKKDSKSPLIGVGGKELSYKRRRGLILRALRGGLLRKPKTLKRVGILSKVRKTTKRETKRPEPRYYFELHKVLRRRKL